MMGSGIERHKAGIGILGFFSGPGIRQKICPFFSSLSSSMQDKLVRNPCVGVSIAMMKHPDQKQLEEERVSLGLHFSIRKSGQELKQGRNLKAGTDVEAMEECCLLACSSWLAQPAF